VSVRQAGVHRLLRCKLVVDASGRNTLLGSQLRIKRKDPLFQQFAVHNWYEGIDRGPAETGDFIHLYILPVRRGWAWQIPISRTVTSVGIVTEAAEFAKCGEPVERWFARLAAGNPVLARRLAAARPIHEFTREGNYSYVMDRFAGDGWLLVGDAARFVDPIFSSGVGVALESARRAATAIISALARNEVCGGAFASYEATLRAGVDLWREFILLYYRLPPLFLDLITSPEAQLQVMRLLQGEVYDRGSVPILERMRQEIRSIEQNPGHHWAPYLEPEQVKGALAGKSGPAPTTADERE
jgi:FADH2 O2-dependent halogenase